MPIASRLFRYSPTTSSGRGLEDHLQLHVLIKSVGVFSVPAVGRTPARLYVGYAIRSSAEDPQERLGTHRPRAHFDVKRLLNDTAVLSPVGLEVRNDFLKGLHPVATRGRGAYLSSLDDPRPARSARPDSSTAGVPLVGRQTRLLEISVGRLLAPVRPRM